MKRALILGKTILLISLMLIIWVSRAPAVTNFLIDDNKFTTITVLDSFTVSFDFESGETCAKIEVWFDINENEVIEDETDFMLFDSANEGEKFCDGSEPDQDGQANGSFKMTVDEFFPLAPGQFILKVEDSGGADTAILYQVQLQSAYIVKGKVTKPPNIKNLVVSANPVTESEPSHLSVSAKKRNTLQADDGDRRMEMMTPTDSTGAYVLYLPAPAPMDWEIRSYDLLQQLGDEWIAPPPVKQHVAGIVEGIDFMFRKSEAFISGSVTDEDLAQLKKPEGGVLEVKVIARDNNSQNILETQTENGIYILPVVAGSYELMVGFEAPDYMYPHPKQNINVQPGDSLTDVDFIAYKSNSQISGRVTENNTTPLAGIEIRTHHEQTGSARTYTNDQGYYNLSVSDKAPDYPVEIAMQYIPGHLMVEGGNLRQVPPGSENVDFNLVPREYHDAPQILKIQDILHDQGLQVRVIWQASGLDIAENTPEPIAEYSVWRGVPKRKSDEVLVQLSKNANYKLVKNFHEMFADIQAIKPGSCYWLEEDSLALWDFIARVPAVQLPKYSLVAPTLGDSTAEGIYYSYFMIAAHTRDSRRHFFSKVRRGYSVDNLCPPKPVVLTSFSENGIVLLWDPSPHPDVIRFNVYRAETQGFTPAEENRIGYTAENRFEDQRVAPDQTYYYRVEAVDDALHRVFSDEVDVNLADVKKTAGTTIPTKFELLPNYPNPFNAATEFQYALPENDYVEIRIYNLMGEEITKLVQGTRKAGIHQIRWDGKDKQGVDVASGIYLYKMKTSEQIFTRKMLLLR